MSDACGAKDENGGAAEPNASEAASDPAGGRTEDEEPTDAAGVSADDSMVRFLTEMAVAERRTPRRLTRLPRLMLEAVQLVWRTDRLSTLAIVLTQIILAVVAAAQVALGGYAVSQLLSLERGGNVNRVTLAIVALAVVSALGSLGASGASQFGRLLGERVERIVTGRVLDVSTQVELVDYDDPSYYDQLSRVLANIPTRPVAVVTSIAALVGGLAGTIALTVTLLVIAPVLVPILFLAAVPLWFVSRREGRMEFDFAVAQTVVGRERYYLQDVLSRRQDAAELRAYGSAPYLRTRWDAMYGSYLDALRTQVRRRYVLVGVGGLIATAVAIATLLTLVVLIRHGSIGLASAAAAAVSVRLLISRLQQLAGGLSTLFESALFLSDYDTFLGRLPAASAPPPSPASPAPFGELRLTDVHFRYPHSRADAVAGVSLTISRGEVVALVGENGSGKTTLAKLMAGLYAPASGEILVNGVPASGPAREALRDQVAVVLQDFTHYALSAAENISLGRPELEPSAEAITAAAGRVGVDSLLSGLPHGYDTRLSKMFADGRELSLGQWQRVALARAFYRDAPLVILDEPTAALDPRAEAKLYEGVRSVLEGRTVLLITHRLASVRSADRIVVLRDGAVTEQGTHDELLAADGLYAELLAFQQNHHIKSDGEFGTDADPS